MNATSTYRCCGLEKSTKPLITCLLALCLSGCGTVYNLGGEHSQTSPGIIYGGVQVAAWTMGSALTSDNGCVINLPAYWFPLGLIDLPLSLVADTMLLPGTLVYAAVREVGGGGEN